MRGAKEVPYRWQHVGFFHAVVREDRDQREVVASAIKLELVAENLTRMLNGHPLVMCANGCDRVATHREVGKPYCDRCTGA